MKDLIDEALREEEISGIEFRNTAIGRQPFVKQTGLSVWEFIMTARNYDLDPERTASHFQYPVAVVQAALNYYCVYPDEINQAIDDNTMGYEAIKRRLPNLRAFDVPGESDLDAKAE